MALIPYTIGAQVTFQRIGDLRDGQSEKDLGNPSIKWMPLITNGTLTVSSSDFGYGSTYLRMRLFGKDYFGRLLTEDLKSFTIRTSSDSEVVYVRTISGHSGRIIVRGTIRFSAGIDFWDEIALSDSSNDGVGHATISYWKDDDGYLRSYHYRTSPRWDYFSVVRLSSSISESIRGREFYGNGVVIELTASTDIDDGTAVYSLNDDRVRLRSGSSLQSKVLRTLGKGEKFGIVDIDPRGDTVGGQRGYWTKVSLGNEIGWIWGRFIEGLELK